ncbi:MAG: DUF5946 family protein [Saprospiraceae bacterium]|jgi:hypothetical protein|nr:DUF5946 family protein [Saprospiraceae bacterium]MDP4998292.1 DUF5946 family protein [Saprospiraceae bacterium]
MHSNIDLLYFYTLNHSNPAFLHQHAVDAFTLQQANTATKPLAVVFALLGLYLYLEEDFTGKAVQQVHIKLAPYKDRLPVYVIPQLNRGGFSLEDVLKATPGPERDAALREWCLAVWDTWKANRDTIRNWLLEHKIIVSGI